MASSAANIDDYTCSICLDTLCNPVQIPCGHSFCEACMNDVMAKSAHCPNCRRPFEKEVVQPALALRRAMMLKHLPCKYCGIRFRIDGLRSHVNICKEHNPIHHHQPASSAACGNGSSHGGYGDGGGFGGSSVGPGSGSPRYVGGQASSVPRQLSRRADAVRPAPSNRATFRCPLCHDGPMDCVDLSEHVSSAHRGDATPVVCPVCVAMPWGDPNKQSSNFVDHMVRRHQFEYDRFVDYDASEEEMLQQAIKVSVHHQ